MYGLNSLYQIDLIFFTKAFFKSIFYFFSCKKVNLVTIDIVSQYNTNNIKPFKHLSFAFLDMFYLKFDTIGFCGSYHLPNTKYWLTASTSI